MGRHRDPDPRWFWLSLAAAAGKGLLAVALVGAVVAGALRLTGSGAQDAGASSSTRTPAVAEGGPSPEDGAPVADDGDAGVGGGGVESLPAEPARTEFQDLEAEDGGDDALVRATVQVLDASGDPAAAADVVAALEELGYQVVAEGRAARGYERTTVFWSTGFEDEAESLRAADDRFAVLERNERLDASIDLHVVVGRDWIAGR